VGKGSVLRAVKEVVILFPPREPFKSRDLKKVVSIIVGYEVSSMTVGQALSRLREAGLVRRIPANPESDDWVLLEAIL